MLTLLYITAGLLIWFLVGLLCGMGALAIDAHMQTRRRFMPYDIQRVIGHNWGLFAFISLAGPIGWGVLLLAAWRGWI